MEDLVELKKVKKPKLTITNNIDESKVMFPNKLKEANETLEKYPLPADLLLDRYSEIQQQEGISISGVIKRANAHNNTFLVMEMHGPYEVHFNIRTMSETLNKLVKTYWGETINVRIRPQINEENQFEYELMAVIDAEV